MQCVWAVTPLAGKRRGSRRASPALRGVAIAGAVAFLAAELSALEHRTAELHEVYATHGVEGAPPGEATAEPTGGPLGEPESGRSEEDTFDRNRAGEQPRAYDADGLRRVALDRDPCQLCRSWHERLASAPALVRAAPDVAELSVPRLYRRQDASPAITRVAIAPKTSPPA